MTPCTVLCTARSTGLLETGWVGLSRLEVLGVPSKAPCTAPCMAEEGVCLLATSLWEEVSPCTVPCTEACAGSTGAEYWGSSPCTMGELLCTEAGVAGSLPCTVSREA